MTKTTLPEYWPGENQFGKILLDLREEAKEGNAEKHKASSPLDKITKNACH